MASFLEKFELILFVILPYFALVTLPIVSIVRHKRKPFTYTSHASQTIENRRHFLAVVPFHIGILVVLVGHLLAFFIPGGLLAWNSRPIRLYALEVTGLAFGIMTLVGMVAVIARRLGNAKLKTVTTRMDWVLYILLLIQVILGVSVAVFNRWGSSWFATVLTPYLWSLFALRPDTTFITGLPVLTKLHIVNAYLLFLVFPYTRLVHMLVAPFPYIWRKPQVVRWYRPAPTVAAAAPKALETRA